MTVSLNRTGTLAEWATFKGNEYRNYVRLDMIHTQSWSTMKSLGSVSGVLYVYRSTTWSLSRWRILPGWV